MTHLLVALAAVGLAAGLAAPPQAAPSHHQLGPPSSPQAAAPAAPPPPPPAASEEPCHAPGPVRPLPAWPAPQHYQLHLEPDLGAGSFAGRVRIQLRGQPGGPGGHFRFALHAHPELQLGSVFYTPWENGRAGSRQPASRLCRLAGEPHVLVVSLGQELAPLGYLEANFSGRLGSQRRGLYLAEAQAAHGELTLASQFQATEARRALPCFDEPFLKATFELSLRVRAGQTALSNTPEVGRAPDDGTNFSNTSASKLNHFEVVSFARTPPMSIYLLAALAGQLAHLERRALGGRVLVRTYAPLERLEHSRPALELAVEALEALERLFGQPYPLAKLDLVALADFEAGAMENWGLVLFRESQLLLDPAGHTAEDRAQVSLTVLHELAHQWLGNLVTMRTWRHLWLNEGLASLIEYRLAEELRPQLSARYIHLLDSRRAALEADSQLRAHPVLPGSELDADEPDEIDALFDSITYSKGASLVGAFEGHYLAGPGELGAALRAYLDQHRYSTATTDDLLEALLGRVEPARVSEARQYLHSWLHQAGHPLVRVSLSGHQLELRQSRFLSANTSAVDTAPTSGQQVWLLPIELRLHKWELAKDELLVGGPQRLLLSQPSQLWELPASWRQELSRPLDRTDRSAAVWLELSCSGALQRLDYAPELLERLLHALRLGRLAKRPKTRMQLLDDCRAQLASGRPKSVELVRLLAELTLLSERHPAVLELAREALLELMRAHAADAADQSEQSARLSERVRSFALAQLSSVYKRAYSSLQQSARAELTWIGDEPYAQLAGLDAGTRASWLELLVQLDYQPLIDSLLQLFDAQLPAEQLHVELRAAAYAAVAARGSDAQLRRLEAKFEHSNTTSGERELIAVALGHARQPQRLEQVWLWLRARARASPPLYGRPDEWLPGALQAMLRSQPGRRLVQRLLDQQLAELVGLGAGPAELAERVALVAGPQWRRAFFARHRQAEELLAARADADSELARRAHLSRLEATQLTEELDLQLASVE